VLFRLRLSFSTHSPTQAKAKAWKTSTEALPEAMKNCLKVNGFLSIPHFHKTLQKRDFIPENFANALEELKMQNSTRN
jgi:hypothetical protein